MKWRQIITVEADQRGGKPCVRGMRITVGDVLGFVATYETWDAILEEYPELTRDDIRACLEFAATRERGLMERIGGWVPIASKQGSCPSCVIKPATRTAATDQNSPVRTVDV
ncbi:MAG: DUF433 domain-containing protein [Pleurocapsa sp. SU_196_0]|nr:DUF433 domain-containing protein [Pleurocapsa sp. SU_196_0]